MDGVTLSLSLDMVGSSTKTTIRAKQCDTNSRFLLISLTANGEPWQMPFDCEIFLYAQKPDKTVVFSQCKQTGWNSVIAPLTEQMLAVPGDTSCELYIAAADGDIKSRIFTLTVDEMLFDKSAIESTNEFNALREKLLELQATTKTSEIATKEAYTAAQKAWDVTEEASIAISSLQVAVDAANAAKASETAAKESEQTTVNTEKAIRDYVELEKASFVGYSKRESDTKYANALTGTATGTGSITVTDAYPAPVLDLAIYGASKQDTTKGVQLLDFDAWRTGIIFGTAVYEGNKIILTATKDDCYTNYNSSSKDVLKIPVKANTTYTFSWECEGAAGKCYLFLDGLVNPSTHLKSAENSEKKLSLTTLADTTFITFRVGVKTAGNTCSYWNLMINEGDTALPYEPYTGGIAAPNPNYPQLIQRVNVENVVSSVAPGDITNSTKATVPATLRGVGAVRDKLYCRNGVWGIERYRYKILVDGATNNATNLNSRWDDSYPTAAHAQLSPLPGWKIGQVNFLSDKLLCTTELDRDFSKTSLSNHRTNNGMYLFIEHILTGVQPEDDTTTKLQKINSWIQNNNFTIEYELTTPVWEPLPDDQQAQLNNLLIYSGDTACVYVTGSEIAPEMALEYVQDSNKVVKQLKLDMAERELDLLAIIDQLKINNNLV